ncbi:hypothetical protein NC651_000400 [Populus alba x Populus x berolinensis]|nr:hypothetical protein NC651_000400 [Populus alba x Populus x berolinensis]
MDGNNNVRGYSDRDLTLRVELGSSSVTRTVPFIQLKKDAANLMHDTITELAIKASSYERHILYLYWLHDKSAESFVYSFLKIQQKGSFLSLVREITQILNSEEHIDD